MSADHDTPEPPDRRFVWFTYLRIALGLVFAFCVGKSL
jgi:hypothetical protein